MANIMGKIRTSIRNVIERRNAAQESVNENEVTRSNAPRKPAPARKPSKKRLGSEGGIY